MDLAQIAPTPIDELRQPAPNQVAIDLDSAALLLATNPSKLERFALGIEEWILRRNSHASNPGGEEASVDGAGE